MGVLLKSQYNIKYANASDGLALKSTPFTPYIGSYIETIFGDRIQGNSILNQGENIYRLKVPKQTQKGGEEFYPYDRLKSKIKQESDKREPRASKPQNLNIDPNKKTFQRYFFLDKRINLWIEVDKKEFNKQNVIDTNIFFPYKITWSLLYPQRNQKIVENMQKLGSINLSIYEFVNQGPYKEAQSESTILSPDGKVADSGGID